MASWAGIIAESGFQYSAVDKSIEFTEKPGKYFWSNGSAWGMCEVEKNSGNYQVKFEVLNGKVEIEAFHLGEHKVLKFNKAKSIDEGENMELQF